RRPVAPHQRSRRRHVEAVAGPAREERRRTPSRRQAPGAGQPCAVPCRRRCTGLRPHPAAARIDRSGACGGRPERPWRSGRPRRLRERAMNTPYERDPAAASAHEDQSVGALLRQLMREVPELFTKELALLKAETRENLQAAKAGLAAVSTGGAVMLAGLV